MKCVAIQQFTSLIAHVQGLLIVHTIIHSIDGHLNTMMYIQIHAVAIDDKVIESWIEDETTVIVTGGF